LVRTLPRQAKLGAAALLAVGGLASVVGAAAGAGAATGSTIATKDTTGYQVSGAQFRYVKTTVYGRAVAQYTSDFPVANTGFGHAVMLASSKFIVTMGVSVYNGDNGPDPWDAAFAVTDTSTGAKVGGCLAGNPSGTGGVTCNTSVTGEPGAFAPGNITLSIYYNPANRVVSFDAYQGSNDFHGFFNAGVGLSFSKASAGTWLGQPSSVHQPWPAQLLGRFSGTVLTNYKGRRFGLVGSFTTSRVQATGPGSVVIAKPSALTGGATGFATYLEPAS
jgi:hypothetical protein